MYYLEDNSVDAIITDPPYLTTDLHFDKQPFNLDRLLSEAKRIVKPNGYLACFAPVEMQAEIAKVFSIRFSGCWFKDQGNMRTRTAKKPMNQMELYCVFAHPKYKVSDLTWNKVFNKGVAYKRTKRNRGCQREGKDQLARANSSTWTQDGFITINDGTRQQTNVIKAPNKYCMVHSERTIHPTQKPLKVIETLIKWLTNENDVILDPFIGSGTTIIAGLKTNRKVIGVEKFRQYHDISQHRINEYLTEPKQHNLI